MSVRALARIGTASFAALLATALSCAAGCGGPTFQNGVFENDYTRYRVGRLGQGWQRMEVSGNDLAFQHDDLGTISVNSTCTDYEDVPVAALVNHLLFDTTDRRFVTEEEVTLAGRGAHHALVHAELDGVPIEIELYVLKKDGCVFDLLHIRSLQAPQAARSDFAAFVQRFEVLRVELDD